MQQNKQDDIQEGYILKLEGDFAKIRVSGHADCDNCKSCSIPNMEILAFNAVNAALGEKVRFLMIQENMIRISFMLFLLPLISIFAGLYAGSLAASFSGLSEALLMTVGAFIFLSAAIVIIYFYDKRYKLNKSNFPQIIEVIK